MYDFFEVQALNKDNNGWIELFDIGRDSMFDKNGIGFFLTENQKEILEKHIGNRIRFVTINKITKDNQIDGYRVIEFYRWNTFNDTMIELGTGIKEYVISNDEYKSKHS